MKNTIRHKIQFTGMVFILSLLLGFSGTDKVAGQQLIPDSLVKIVEVSAVDSAKKNADTTKASQKGKASTDEEALRPLQISEIVSIPKIIWSLIFIILGYFIIRVLIGIISSLAIRYPKYDFTIKRIIPIFRILAWIFVIYVIVIGIFNPPAATLFAFFTSIGVAVGFAAQDLLKNVFGGLVVMFDKPFQIGDKIEAGKYYGEVVEIGIRSTKVVTPDDSLVTVPNSEFMIQYVSNSNSGENNCQVVAELYLPIDINTEQVREIATEAAQISKYIYLNKPIVVLFFNEIKDKRVVLKMRLKAYVSDLSKEFYFKSEMTEIVLKSLIEKKIIQEDFYKN
ncbi:MAG: mechanosensitive ion channel family protein [Bacteroidales bacterium]|nr:mechanosensitive ion channel family protein [Bacteroidales bacterium]